MNVQPSQGHKELPKQFISSQPCYTGATLQDSEMGTTVLLEDLDFFFFKMESLIPSVLVWAEGEGRGKSLLLMLNEATWWQHLLLCTSEFITGAWDKFKPFTRVLLAEKWLYYFIARKQFSSSTYNSKNFKSQVLQHFGTLQTAAAPAWPVPQHTLSEINRISGWMDRLVQCKACSWCVYITLSWSDMSSDNPFLHKWVSGLYHCPHHTMCSVYSVTELLSVYPKD